MAWTIEYLESVQKDMRKIDRQTQQRIKKYLKERIIVHDDPRQLGKPLSGELSGFWRYRVGDYRLICELQDEVMTVLVVQVGHRREIYR